MKNKIIILLLIFSINGMAQLSPEENKRIDSLREIIKTASSDTSKINALFEWDNLIYLSDVPLDLDLNKKISGLCEKNLRKELSNKEKDFYSRYYGRSLNNIGLFYYSQGNYSLAIDYYTRSLKEEEFNGDKKGAANSLNNIGIVYDLQNDRKKALEYHQRSLKQREEIGDKQGVANSLLNIGTIYSIEKEYAKSIECYTKSLEMHVLLGDKYGIANAELNIGTSYKLKGDYAAAIDHYSKSLKIYEEINDAGGISSALGSIGSVYDDQKEYRKAIPFLEKALSIAKANNVIVEMQNSGNSLYMAYKNTGRFPEALAMHELYVEMKDSINNENAKKEVVRQEFKYEYEKKTAADDVRASEEKKVIAAQFKQEQTKRYALYGGLALLLLFAGFMFNRFRVTRNQKRIIEHQKSLVEEKQKEILDSIYYARRIQQALLPREKYIEKSLKKFGGK